ncbi:hypothetical protein NE237_024243 [Protea cynaroides]|uniref:Uncharacterized protein n=1 Tax=Protea cynaroides TaxID=273540 RepID=A0A9Q0HEA4_9MAGN|nr:hypothetical protein NE237_024243 [Protea cynaroides]
MEKTKQHTQPLQVKVLDITSVVDSSVPKTEGPIGDLGRSGSLHASESVYSGVSDFEGQRPINFHDFSTWCTTEVLSRNLEGESHLREAEWPDQDGTVALCNRECSKGDSLEGICYGGFPMQRLFRSWNDAFEASECELYVMKAMDKS